MKFGIVLDPVFDRHHNPPGHPERSDRNRAVTGQLEAWEHFSRLHRVEPVDLDEKWLLAVHSTSHVDRIRSTSGQPYVELDPDTHTASESFAVARLAAGSTIRLAELMFAGEIDSGFALVRPPGHHAESDRPMGFCLFNNVAIAAQWAISNERARRVAVVDFDVHHGNGTQEIFYRRPDVLYISSHQYPFYPGTGHFREAGRDEGLGFTVNFPVRSGMGNFFHARLYEQIAVPVLRQFEPDLMLVSAGFDAHRADPLGGMELDETGFGRLAFVLNQTAAEICSGRILYVLEGGYNLEALAACVLTTVATSLFPRDVDIPEHQREEFEVYHEEVGEFLKRFWKL